MKYLKYLLYIILIVFLVPLQVILFTRAGTGAVHTDLALVAVCLIGFKAGELDAIAMGLFLGFTQDLFTGGLYWENLWLKPLIGLLAGLASRNVMNFTLLFSLAFLLAFSIFSGTVMFIVKSLQGPGVDFLTAARHIILPQALYDAAVGVTILKLIQYWTTYWTGPGRRRLPAVSYE
jgi:hypothetical protein